MVDDDLAFANYVEAPSQVDPALWMGVRVVILGGLAGFIVAGFLWPEDTLTIFWGLAVPVLPAIWLLAPGLWRNTCPLATANQLPRVLGFSLARTAPRWWQRGAYSIGVLLFVSLVLTRKLVFNTNGAALSILLVSVVSAAFVGGLLLKGKSGWCSAICPLLPIQRLYGQAPVVRIPNAHCTSCVGCAKNCFDFNPGVAYVADQYDSDAGYRGQRRLFAGAFPGLVVAFFTVGTADEIGAWSMYAQSIAWIAGGIAIFTLADIYLRVRPNALPPLFAAAGFTLFYWHALPVIAAALDDQIGGSWDIIVWPGRIAAGVCAGAFVLRATRTEDRYVEETSVASPVRANVPSSALDTGEGPARVSFPDHDRTVDAPDQPSVLEVVEGAALPIESGCRMGVCGADPIAVVSGLSGLTEPLPSELNTLRRLGLGPPNRLACTARVIGACAVSLKPDPNALPEPEAPTFEYDTSVRRVVVIGNGVAGMTAADHVRRNHPDCTIDVVGREAHHLYNRMGISKLIYSPTGVQDLQLLPPGWHERNGITPWLNTTVDHIDRDACEVVLGTRERLPYDRLILATGSTSAVPSIQGFERPGCFTLRSAEHAVQIRAYVQENGANHAFVAGGGLLGLEAAYSLHRLGLAVTVGERSDRVLRRNIDERASEILTGFLIRAGIDIRHGIEIAAADGRPRLASITTTSGEEIAADVLLVAAGITPSVGLALRAGLEVDRGVVVGDDLRTSDPAIFAVGDVAQHRDALWGLWGVAVEQAEVAARNAVGATDTYQGEIPTTILKGAGIDLTSFGEFAATGGDEVSIEADSFDPPIYRKVIRRDGELVGGTFINSAEEAVAAQAEYQAVLRARQESSGASGAAVSQAVPVPTPT